MIVGNVVLTDLQSDNNCVFTLKSAGNQPVKYLSDLAGGHAEQSIHYICFSREYSIMRGDVERAISLFHDGKEVFIIWGDVIKTGEIYRYGQQTPPLKPLKVGDILVAEDLTKPGYTLELKIISLNA